MSKAIADKLAAIDTELGMLALLADAPKIAINLSPTSESFILSDELVEGDPTIAGLVAQVHDLLADKKFPRDGIKLTDNIKTSPDQSIRFVRHMKTWLSPSDKARIKEQLVLNHYNEPITDELFEQLVQHPFDSMSENLKNGILQLANETEHFLPYSRDVKTDIRKIIADINYVRYSLHIRCVLLPDAERSRATYRLYSQVRLSPLALIETLAELIPGARLFFDDDAREVVQLIEQARGLGQVDWNEHLDLPSLHDVSLQLEKGTVGSGSTMDVVKLRCRLIFSQEIEGNWEGRLSTPEYNREFERSRLALKEQVDGFGLRDRAEKYSSEIGWRLLNFSDETNPSDLGIDISVVIEIDIGDIKASVENCQRFLTGLSGGDDE